MSGSCLLPPLRDYGGSSGMLSPLTSPRESALSDSALLDETPEQELNRRTDAYLAAIPEQVLQWHDYGSSKTGEANRARMLGRLAGEQVRRVAQIVAEVDSSRAGEDFHALSQVLWQGTEEARLWSVQQYAAERAGREFRPRFEPYVSPLHTANWDYALQLAQWFAHDPATRLEAVVDLCGSAPLAALIYEDPLAPDSGQRVRRASTDTWAIVGEFAAVLQRRAADGAPLDWLAAVQPQDGTAHSLAAVNALTRERALKAGCCPTEFVLFAGVTAKLATILQRAAVQAPACRAVALRDYDAAAARLTKPELVEAYRAELQARTQQLMYEISAEHRRGEGRAGALSPENERRLRRLAVVLDDIADATDPLDRIELRLVRIAEDRKRAVVAAAVAAAARKAEDDSEGGASTTDGVMVSRTPRH
jgi:hypothetical protein